MVPLDVAGGVQHDLPPCISEKPAGSTHSSTRGLRPPAANASKPSVSTATLRGNGRLRCPVGTGATPGRILTYILGFSFHLFNLRDWGHPQWCSEVFQSLCCFLWPICPEKEPPRWPPRCDEPDGQAPAPPCGPGESGLVSRGSQGLRSPLESRRGSLGAP